MNEAIRRALIGIACGLCFSSARAEAKSTNQSETGNLHSSISEDYVSITDCNVESADTWTKGNFNYFSWKGNFRIDISSDVDSSDLILFGFWHGDLAHPMIASIISMKHMGRDAIPQWVAVDQQQRMSFPIRFKGKKTFEGGDLDKIVDFSCGVLRVIMRNGDLQTDAHLKSLYRKVKYL